MRLRFKAIGEPGTYRDLLERAATMWGCTLREANFRIRMMMGLFHFSVRSYGRVPIPGWGVFYESRRAACGMMEGMEYLSMSFRPVKRLRRMEVRNPMSAKRRLRSLRR